MLISASTSLLSHSSPLQLYLFCFSPSSFYFFFLSFQSYSYFHTLSCIISPYTLLLWQWWSASTGSYMLLFLSLSFNLLTLVLPTSNEVWGACLMSVSSLQCFAGWAAINNWQTIAPISSEGVRRSLLYKQVTDIEWVKIYSSQM